MRHALQMCLTASLTLVAVAAILTATNAAAARMADLDSRIAFSVRVTGVREGCRKPPCRLVNRGRY